MDSVPKFKRNFLHHASANRSERHAPTNTQKKGIYEVGTAIDVASKVDELSRKLDQLMVQGPTQTLSNSYSTPSEVCALCASPSHTIYECPSAAQFSEFVQE